MPKFDSQLDTEILIGITRSSFHVESSTSRVRCLQRCDGIIPSWLTYTKGRPEKSVPFFFRTMHLLYLDESGSVADATQQYFVLAGAAVFERATHWVEQDLNAIAERFSPGAPHAIELHGSPMRGGRDGWRKFPLADRIGAIQDALRAGTSVAGRRNAVLFAAVVKKSALVGVDPVEHAFECLSTRFDNYLRRLYLKHNDRQRGLMLFDKASTELRIQNLARDFKYSGHAAGKTRNYAEVPVFLDSKASRLIQLADLVAFALYRHFEHKDSQLFDVIKDSFDTEGGVNHGLYVCE